MNIVRFNLVMIYNVGVIYTMTIQYRTVQT